MKTMNLILVLFALLSSYSNAQTPEITHKSHSGNHGTFVPGSDGNFGLPNFPPVITKAERVNDSTTIVHFKEVYGGLYREIYYNDPFWSQETINFDSIQRANYNGEEIEFVGFVDKNGIKKANAAVNKKENKLLPLLLPFIFGGLIFALTQVSRREKKLNYQFG